MIDSLSIFKLSSSFQFKSIDTTFAILEKADTAFLTIAMCLDLLLKLSYDTIN